MKLGKSKKGSKSRIHRQWFSSLCILRLAFFLSCFISVLNLINVLWIFHLSENPSSKRYNLLSWHHTKRFFLMISWVFDILIFSSWVCFLFSSRFWSVWLDWHWRKSFAAITIIEPNGVGNSRMEDWNGALVKKLQDFKPCFFF